MDYKLLSSQIQVIYPLTFKLRWETVYLSVYLNEIFKCLKKPPLFTNHKKGFKFFCLPILWIFFWNKYTALPQQNFQLPVAKKKPSKVLHTSEFTCLCVLKLLSVYGDKMGVVDGYVVWEESCLSRFNDYFFPLRLYKTFCFLWFSCQLYASWGWEYLCLLL